MLKVWLVTGNDDMDDPAWGMSPIFTGKPDEVRAWVQSQPHLAGQLVVKLEGGRTAGAEDRGREAGAHR